MNNSLDPSNPYLSIVIACRNDNYAGSMSKKLILSLTILIQQLNKFNLDTEIIIVEWNPPKDKPKLSLEISSLKNLGKTIIRIIEVDPSIHSTYIGSQKKGIAGSVALNAGIRRARGKFVTSKTADSFFSDELIKFISKKTLDNNCFYRADRVDVNVNQDLIESDWRDYFNSNVSYRGYYSKKGPHLKACGDFMLMSKKSWEIIRGFTEPKTVIGLGEDAEALYAAMGIGLKQICLKDDQCIYKISHSNQHSNRVIGSKNKVTSFLTKILDKLDELIFFFKIKNMAIFIARPLLGILNLPPTKIHGLRVRSHYRWYITSMLRYKLGGINFIRSKDWGLNKIDLDETIIN